MIDLFLRADDEAALIAALPMLRGKGPEGADIWLTGSPWHALDLEIPVMNPAETRTRRGKQVVIKEAEPHPAFHANLRLLPEHEDYTAIRKAVEPFLVTPEQPTRVFAP